MLLRVLRLGGLTIYKRPELLFTKSKRSYKQKTVTTPDLRDVIDRTSDSGNNPSCNGKRGRNKENL